MKFSELIDSCIECVKGFNPIVKTLDSHADDFLVSVSVPLSPHILCAFRALHTLQYLLIGHSNHNLL